MLCICHEIKVAHVFPSLAPVKVFCTLQKYLVLRVLVPYSESLKKGAKRFSTGLSGSRICWLFQTKQMTGSKTNPNMALNSTQAQFKRKFDIF